MVFFEACLPSARRFFHRPLRFPIADAHYAMGFAFLFESTGDPAHLDRARELSDRPEGVTLQEVQDLCWGYPFDWVTRGGTITRDTPLITTTPYAYEAFLQVCQHDSREEWHEALRSIVRHARADIADFRTSDRGSTCSYTPSTKEA